MRLDVKLRTNEQRVALLRDCGWEVIEEPRGEREVQIPEEFDEVYESYNQIQLAQGLDLTPCRGRRATLLHLRDHKPPGAASRALQQICSSGAGS